jgi:hypothetical protein
MYLAEFEFADHPNQFFFFFGDLQNGLFLIHAITSSRHIHFSRLKHVPQAGVGDILLQTDG